MNLFAGFISLFYLVGFAVLGYGLWSALRSNQAAGWPTSPGVIRNVTLEDRHDGDGTTYEVKVEYAYLVDGVEYMGSRLAYGYAASSGHEPHNEIYQKLKAAKTIDVRYNPLDPSSSVLSYGMHRSIQFTLAFGVTWLAFVIGFSVLGWLASQSDSVLLENLSIR